MAPTPTPTPAPSGGGSVTDLFKQLNAAADGKSSGGGKKNPDLYGLGQWQGQTVNPGDLPITVNVAAAQKNTTADAVVEAFAHGRPDQVATIQHALMMSGGYYPSNYTPKYGVISSEDVAAFSKAVRTAGQAGQSVSDLLTTQAKYGAVAGIQAAQQITQQAQRKIATVTLPNTTDVEAEATAAFQKVLGRKATPQEQARFASLYRGIVAGVQRANNQMEYNAQTGSNPAALQNVNAGQLVGAATASAEQQMIAGSPPNMGVLHPGGPGQPGAQLGLGAADTTQGDPANFSSQIGGLMSLGQAVAAAQQAPGSASGGGLTQLNEESAPSASVAAENFARNADPKGAAANDLASTFNDFLSILHQNFG